MLIFDPNCGAFWNPGHQEGLDKQQRGFFCFCFFSAGAEKYVNNNRSFCDRRPSCRQQHVRNTPHVMSPVVFFAAAFFKAISPPAHPATPPPPRVLSFFHTELNLNHLSGGLNAASAIYLRMKQAYVHVKSLIAEKGGYGGVIIDKQRGMYWMGVCGRVKKSFASALAPQAAC